MRAMISLVLLAFVLETSASALGTQQSTGVPTPRSSNSPFGSNWAKPFPQTGGYMYNDPRFQGSNQPIRPNVVCPRGIRSNGSCY
jgi:hypothetical protein